MPTDRVVIIYKNLGKIELVEKKETEMADFLGVVLCENYEEKLGGFIGNTTFHEDDVHYEFKLYFGGT